MSRKFTSQQFKEIVNAIILGWRTGNKDGSLRSALAPYQRLNETFALKPDEPITKHSFYLTHVPRIRAIRPELNLNNDLKYFKKVLNIAYDNELISQPAIRLPTPSISEDIGKEIQPQDIKKLLSTRNQDLKLQIELGITSGMRKQEILGFRYRYLDMETGFVTLPAGERRGGIMHQVDKTKRGRSFALPMALVHKIRERYNRCPHKEYLFPSPCDPKRPVHDNKTAWNTLLTKHGLNYIFHDTRRTAATIKLRAGVPMIFVSNELGMSLQVLKRIYAKLQTKDYQASAEAAYKAIG